MPRVARPVVLVNGTAEPADLSVLAERGVMLGDGVFETLPVFDDVAWLLDAHLLRMARAAARIGIAPPRDGLWRADITRALALRRWTGASVLRLVAVHADGPATASPARGIRVVVLMPHRAFVGARARECSAGVVVVNPAVPDDATLSHAGIKSTSFGLHLLAQRSAMASGFDAAILASAAGEVIEAATANVFLVSGGRLHTPSLDRGCLAGITRAEVLDIAAQSGIVGVERRLTLDELHAADEVFLTSSVRGIVAVVSVDRRPVGRGVAGHVAERIRASRQARIDAACGGQSPRQRRTGPSST